jgi:hypothetical protein
VDGWELRGCDVGPSEVTGAVTLPTVAVVTVGPSASPPQPDNTAASRPTAKIRHTVTRHECRAHHPRQDRVCSKGCIDVACRSGHDAFEVTAPA